MAAAQRLISLKFQDK